MKSDKIIKILWAVCVIPFVIGLFLIDTVNTEYSTDEYWVAQNQQHVYERYSGQIVDYIEENEVLKIKSDVIIVKAKSDFYGFGMFLTVIFGLFTFGMIIGEVQSSDWWKDFKERNKL